MAVPTAPVYLPDGKAMVRGGKFVIDAEECCCEGYLPPLDDGCPEYAHCMAFFEDTYHCTITASYCASAHPSSPTDCSGSYSLYRNEPIENVPCSWSNILCDSEHLMECAVSLVCTNDDTWWLRVQVCLAFAPYGCEWRKDLGNGPAGNYTLWWTPGTDLCSETVTVYS